MSGKLQGVLNGVLQIEREDGQTVQVALPNDPTRVIYQATALPAGLPPGCVVRFSADLDEKAKVVGAARDFVVFTPVPPANVDQNNPDSVMAWKQNTFGVYQTGEATAGIERSGARGPQPVGSFLIVGRVGKVTQRTMTVEAPGALVELPITSEMTIPVTLIGSFDLAQPGDAVQLNGFSLPTDDQKVWAEAVTVTAIQTLGEASAKAERRGSGTKESRERKSRRAKNKSGDDDSAKSDEKR
jgi:hypothetical protein